MAEGLHDRYDVNTVSNGFINKPVRIGKLRALLDGILDQGGDGQNACRAGDVQVNTAVFDPRKELQANTNSRAVLMLSMDRILLWSQR